MYKRSLRSGRPCRHTRLPTVRSEPPTPSPPPSPSPPPPARAPSAAKPLPFEILDMIFQRAVAPSFLLDSSLTAGPNSPWCHARNTKLAVTLVSRTWYGAGIALLYKQVVFRRLNQIPALLETLEKSPSTFGVLVREMTLDMFVSPDYAASFTRHVQRIVDLCPRLVEFIFSSPLPLPAKAVLHKLSTSVRHLQVDAWASPTELYALLKHTCKSLVSLSIHVHDPPEHLATRTVYTLPRLESLTLKISHTGVDAWPLLGHILATPALARLTFELLPGRDSSVDQWSHRWDSMIGPITVFCTRYSDTLKFLNINPGFLRKAGFIQPLLDVCPNLEHLVVYNGATLESHPALKWVDICTSKMFGVDDESRWAHDAAFYRLRKAVTATPATFPALRGLRHIRVCSPRFNDIATRLPPASVSTPSEAYELSFPGVYVRHEHGLVTTARHVDCGGAMYDSEDPLYINMEYELECDPDEGRTDGTTTASERSLKQLRRREGEGDVDVGEEGSSTVESECTIRADLWDGPGNAGRPQTGWLAQGWIDYGI